MQNVDEQAKTRIKKNQTFKPTGKIGPQEKILPRWKMSFAT